MQPGGRADVPSGAASAATPRERIGLVADDAELGDVLRQILMRSGYDAVALTAADAEDGWVVSAEPDLIAIEIGGPASGGEAVFRQLLADEARRAPVLLYGADPQYLENLTRTSTTMAQVLMLPMPFGMDDFLDVLRRLGGRPATDVAR